MDVSLTEGPVDTNEAIRHLTAAGGGAVGAVVSFTGVVRGDALEDGSVESIAFDCYPEMAIEELTRVRSEAIGRFGLSGLVIVHRTGILRVGEEIVLVAAAARHRPAAFEAAAWAMDQVKLRVPLWKREQGSGRTRWVEGVRSSVGAEKGTERKEGGKERLV